MINRLTITKEYTWDMAHMLAEHEGLCLNVHGHTYKMQVDVARKQGATFVQTTGPASGMVTDFKELKEVVANNLVCTLDHSFMYWTKSPDQVEHVIANALIGANRRVIQVPYRPTAENMAMDFIMLINRSLKLREADYFVTSLRIWETPTSFAEVHYNGN